MSIAGWTRRTAPVVVLALSFCLACAETLRAQEDVEVEEADDPDLALARASKTWTVVEKSGSERWNATWTLRADGKTFDGHWQHEPGGDEGDLRGFARILSIKGSSIVIDRPGLGRYTGTISPDRRRISGRMSWGGGTWEARLDPGALPSAVGGKSAGNGGTSSAPSSAGKGSAGKSGVSAPKLTGQRWDVIESAGQERWDSEWTVRADGKSFDAVWVHTPGNDRGRLSNFARIASISGNQIVVERPGLGRYTGTISPDRRTVRGRMSWSSGTWQATLPSPLP